MSKTIVSLIPAKGWWAVYRDDRGAIFGKLAAWALVREGEDYAVVGLDGEGCSYPVLADEAANFDQYMYCPTRPEAAP